MLAVKVSRYDIHQLIDVADGAVEFALWSEDLEGEWVGEMPPVAGLAVHAPEKFADDRLIDLSSPDENIRQASLRIITKTIRLARRLGECCGCDPVIILHPGGIHPVEQPLSGELLVRSVNQLPPAKLLLENMPHYYWYNNQIWVSCMFKEAEEIISILDETKLGLCLDISHAKMHCNHTGEDFYEYVKTLAPCTQHIHVADALGESGEGLQIGDGEIDFQRVFNILGDRDVMVVPEIKDGHQNRGLEFKIAIERLTKIILQS
jgi:N-acetylneuraminate synthase